MFSDTYLVSFPKRPARALVLMAPVDSDEKTTPKR
jgi:hypothetical protein